MAFGTHGSQAEALLRAWIKTSQLSEGSRMPSERELAKTLGVQHYALNRAMAHLLAEGAVVREGYKLFCGPQKAIEGPFSCHLVIYRGSSLLRSYRKLAKELGIALIIHFWTTFEDTVSILHELDSTETTGVIFDPPFGYGAPSWQQAAEQLASHGVPLVCVESGTKGVSRVMGDYPRALELILSHLKELGHQELALMSISPSTLALHEILEAWRSLCKNNGHRSSVGRIHIPNKSIPLREDMAELTDRLTGEWNNVTGLVFYSESVSNLAYLLERLAIKKKHIPEDLSIICLRDSNSLRTLTPPISATESDLGVIHETAFRLVQRLARNRNEPGFSRLVRNIRIQPELVLRGSTASIHASTVRQGLLPTEAIMRPSKAESDKSSAEIERNLDSALQQPYSLAARAENSRFEILNLKSLVNRPLNFRRGWLGDLPLKHFDPGEHVIHGVPFQILGGPSRSDCGAVIFQSRVNTMGNAQELPQHMQIPIESKVKAIYFLHGCGYARFLKPFATYGFYRGKKQVDEISLVPLGQPPPNFNFSTPTPDFSKANIQDWWPDLPQVDFPHARMAPIKKGTSSDAAPRHIYLYTLEWVNPSPEKPINYLEISVDSAQSTTLGLLAVSVLKP